jgi:hypothetical protein
VCCGLTTVTEAGRTLALAAIEPMEPGGGTNLWAGLALGMQLLDEAQAADKKAAAQARVWSDEAANSHQETIANMGNRHCISTKN